MVDFLKYFSRLLMILLVMPVTNTIKGVVAKKLGDTTAEDEGRLTLNPFSHIDFVGSIMILLIGIGWSKPMPINPRRMRNPQKGIFIISLTGPLSYFASSIVCDLIFNILVCIEPVRESLNSGEMTAAYGFLLVLSILSQINICLGVITLLPIPQMDGFNILMHFTGAKFHNWYYQNYQTVNMVSMIAIIILFTLPDSINPLVYLINFFGYILNFATSWIPQVLCK